MEQGPIRNLRGKRPEKTQNDAAPRHNVALGCSDQRNVGLGLPVLHRRHLGLRLPCNERVPSVRRNS
jgi:hypothetical protein